MNGDACENLNMRSISEGAEGDFIAVGIDQSFLAILRRQCENPQSLGARLRQNVHPLLQQRACLACAVRPMGSKRDRRNEVYAMENPPRHQPPTAARLRPGG